MSELRQDPTTEEWVIIARERAMRPNDFIHRRSRIEAPDFSPTCPFCPGNESMTSHQILLYQQQGGNGWQVRAFANKFAALNPDSKTTRHVKEGLLALVARSGRYSHNIEIV